MGIDIVLFRATKLDDTLVAQFEHQDIEKMLAHHEFDYISEETYKKHEQDYEELRPYLTPVLMKQTFTDRKKYMAAAGIPEGLNWYSSRYDGIYTTITYNENGTTKQVRLTNEDIHKFDYVKESIYYIYDKEYMDVRADYSIRDVVWDIVNSKIQARFQDNERHTYVPHKLTPEESTEIVRAIAKAYKADEVYVSDDSMRFIMEMLCNEDEENLFIMGEN